MNEEFFINNIDFSKLKTMKFCVDKELKEPKHNIFEFINPRQLCKGHKYVNPQIARKALKKALIEILSEGFAEKDKEKINYINKIFSTLEKKILNKYKK